jgi:alkanesulfonate monooxygenase SsuD/methylene tetrahydromethanopterin reductase-like flavin-dependent oxidoreductase (luciferase family)
VIVRVGIRYELHASHAEPGALYAALLAHAEEAEARGAQMLWLSERPFAPDTRVPAALPLCAAIAARTSRAHVGAGPLPLPLYHPLRLAEDAASLDGVSGGRLELAVGLGADSEGFDGFGIAQKERVPRFEEALALLRLAFRSEPIRFEGRFHRVRDLAVWPAPVQPGGPPIWIAAGAPAAVRRAALLGDGLLQAAEGVAPAAFLGAWREAGRDAGAARVALEVVAGADGDPWRRSVGAAVRRAEGFARVDLLVSATPGESSGADALDALPRIADAVKSLREGTDERGGTGGAGG